MELLAAELHLGTSAGHLGRAKGFGFFSLLFTLYTMVHFVVSSDVLICEYVPAVTMISFLVFFPQRTLTNIVYYIVFLS